MTETPRMVVDEDSPASDGAGLPELAQALAAIDFGALVERLQSTGSAAHPSEFESLCRNLATHLPDARSLGDDELANNPFAPALVRFAAVAMVRYIQELDEYRQDSGDVSSTERYSLLAECFLSKGVGGRPDEKWTDDLLSAYVAAAAAESRKAWAAGESEDRSNRQVLNAACALVPNFDDLNSTGRKAVREKMRVLLARRGYIDPA